MWIVELTDNNFGVSHWGPYADQSDAVAFASHCSDKYGYGYDVIPLRTTGDIAMLVTQKLG